jgi:hypothetical protein
MTLTGDPLVTVRGLLHDHWGDGGEVTPDAATIGDGGFAVITRRQKMESRAVTVVEDHEEDYQTAGGSAPPVLVHHYMFLGAWTLDKTELTSMLTEIRRIILEMRANPGGGIHHLQFAVGGRPRHDLATRPPIVAKEIRICAVYWL